MDFRILVQSLTLDEMNQLSSIIFEARRKYYEQNLRPVTTSMIELVKTGRWIEAIKEYRQIYGSSLHEAEVAIDTIRNPGVTEEFLKAK